MIVFNRRHSLGLGAIPAALAKAGQSQAYTGNNGAKCQAIAAATVPDAIIRTWIPIDPTNVKDPDTAAGYVADCGCYRWGYRPQFPKLLGVGRVKGDDGSGIRENFNICVSCSAVKATTCPTCPPPVKCPPQVSCPTCPACADTSALTPSSLAPDWRSKYGVNIGLLVAATMVGGVGYYGYKHGWFKKGKGKRR